MADILHASGRAALGKAHTRLTPLDGARCNKVVPPAASRGHATIVRSNGRERLSSNAIGFGRLQFDPGRGPGPTSGA